MNMLRTKIYQIVDADGLPAGTTTLFLSEDDANTAAAITASCHVVPVWLCLQLGVSDMEVTKLNASALDLPNRVEHGLLTPMPPPRQMVGTPAGPATVQLKGKVHVTSSFRGTFKVVFEQPNEENLSFCLALKVGQRVDWEAFGPCVIVSLLPCRRSHSEQITRFYVELKHEETT